MKKYRGLHNLMQRRASFRCPSPPARVYARPPAPPRARVTLKPPLQPYTHRHHRPVDHAKLREFVKSMERLNRQLSRQKTLFDRGIFGPAPMRENLAARRERERRWNHPTTCAPTVRIHYTSYVSTVSSDMTSNW